MNVHLALTGVSAMDADEGFIFLFNPSMLEGTAQLTIDESLGISNISANANWSVSLLYPTTGTRTHARAHERAHSRHCARTCRRSGCLGSWRDAQCVHPLF